MDLELMKADIEAVAAKVLKRATKVELDEVCDQEGEPVQGLIVDGFLIVYPVPNLKPTIGGKMIEIEDVAIDILVGGDGQFEEPDQMRHPMEGCIFQTESNAITEVIALLAKADAEGHLEAIGEERHIREMAEAEKELKAKTPRRVGKNRQIQVITIQQRTLCCHCGGQMPAGLTALWLRSIDEGDGGLFHKECLEVEDA